MDKAQTITIITEELKKEKVYLGEGKSVVWNKKTQQKLLEEKKTIKKIRVFDITANKNHKKNEHIRVKDHINKTGKNPLIIKNKKIEFIDMTKVYSFKEKGITTTSFGKKYKQQINKVPYPSTEISLIAIWCRSVNPKIIIEGLLINIR